MVGNGDEVLAAAHGTPTGHFQPQPFPEEPCSASSAVFIKCAVMIDRAVRRVPNTKAADDAQSAGGDGISIDGSCDAGA